jgi:transcriptional regulator
MFTSPITVTVSSVDYALVLLDDATANASKYRLLADTGNMVLNIRHTSYKDKARPGIEVQRHNVELIHTIYPTESNPSTTVRKAYLVFENDLFDGVTAPQAFVEGFIAFFTATRVGYLVNGLS